MLLRSVLSALLVCAPLLSAQQGELEFREAAAAKLDAYAKACFDAGYPKRAREIWLEVIWDYVTDDEKARKALGFVRVGTSWAPDSRFEYPQHEQPDAKAARALQKRWEALCKELGKGHRELAQRLAAAGDEAGAQTHFERCLRFLPEDPVAAKARGLRNLEGVIGSEVELEILGRTRRIERAVERELGVEYPVEPHRERHPLLDKAGVEYTAVRSEHFVVWGDFEQELLELGARFAERSLAFCRELMTGDDRFAWPSGGRHGLAFFRGKPKWTEIIRANADQFPESDLEFILQNASITAMGTGPNRLRVAGLEGQAELEDFSVREVAQVYAGLKTDALHEGIGHTVVGWFFGRNLIFTIGQDKPDGRTSTGAERNDARFQLPDLSVWEDLAAEAAWDRSDFPTAKLPLVTSASFPNEARIKAWSICDYLLRREPRLMLELDSTKAGGATNERAVADAFAQATGLTVESIDDGWRAFWTRDTPVMRAIRDQKTPLEAVSKQAPAFLDAFNRERSLLEKVYRTKAVGWVAAHSGLCKDHAFYLKSNGSERGPIEEHTQVAGKRGYSVAGRDFARTALVSTDAKDPAQAIEPWLHWPGYRDALINETIDSVGLYVDGKIAVLDVTRGIARRPMTRHYPSGNQKDVPVEIAVQELGDELEALLAEHGRKRQKVVGYPLTYHFYSALNLPEESSIRCRVTRGGDEIEGIVHVADGGESRRTSAPGLVVFYPFDPLPRGSELDVLWEWAKENGEVEKTTFKFKTR